jgi:formate-dependent nitrite reductase membrane component NrfD
MSNLPGGYTPSSDDVGRSGVQNFGRGSRAATGTGGGRRRRRRAEQTVVPDAEFTSYYGRPILKASPWTVDIPAYLFTGGLAGGSAVLAAGADLTGRAGLRRAGRLGAFGGILASFYFLVHDLGRPSRFLNMLRVAKPTSPMSVGTWILTAFGPAAGVAAAAEFRRYLPKRLRWAARLLGLLERPAGLGAAAVGPAVMAYTAVLIADTATPTWHEGYREMPFVFVGSGALAAGGVGLIAAPPAETGPARAFALGGLLLELGAEHRMEQSMGITAEPLHEGKPGMFMKASKALGIAGGIGTLFAGRSRAAAVASGAGLIAASACTRAGIFYAGQASARDPKYTVVPQRERLAGGPANHEDHAAAVSEPASLDGRG